MERKYPFVFLCAFKMDFILFPYGAFIKECLSLNFQWGNLSSKNTGMHPVSDALPYVKCLRLLYID